MGQIRKFEPGLSYLTKTCQNVALCRAGVCSDETAACLFLVFDKSVALHLVEIIESDTQSLSGFEFSIDFFIFVSSIGYTEEGGGQGGFRASKTMSPSRTNKPRVMKNDKGRRLVLKSKNG